jgi:hypothetical protein
MCEKCKIYLYDYFQQPIDKENPLYFFIKQKNLQEKIPSLVSLTMNLLFSELSPFLLRNAKSELDNYCSFIYKPDNPQKKYDILYRFLKQNQKVAKELKFYEDSVADLMFLKIKQNDKYAFIAQQWLAYLIGSLFEDMYELHSDHSGKTPFERINLRNGPPGRPFKNNLKKEIVEDELYT